VTGQGTTPTAGNGEGSNDQVGAGSLPRVQAAPDVARCRCCEHPLKAPASVRRGFGPVCWSRVLASLRAVPPDAWHVRLEVDGGRVVRMVLEPQEERLRGHQEELLRGGDLADVASAGGAR